MSARAAALLWMGRRLGEYAAVSGGRGLSRMLCKGPRTRLPVGASALCVFVLCWLYIFPVYRLPEQKEIVREVLQHGRAWRRNQTALNQFSDISIREKKKTTTPGGQEVAQQGQQLVDIIENKVTSANNWACKTNQDVTQLQTKVQELEKKMQNLNENTEKVIEERCERKLNPIKNFLDTILPKTSLAQQAASKQTPLPGEDLQSS